MPEYSGFDALSHAIELLDEAWNWFNHNGLDGCDTEDLVRAHWWMTTSNWQNLLGELTSELEGSLDRPVGRADGTWLVPSTKKTRKGWDMDALTSAAITKFRVRAVDENGEPFSALNDEVLKVFAPAMGRTKQWRERVLGVYDWTPKSGEEDPLDEYAGTIEYEPVLVVSEEDPNE